MPACPFYEPAPMATHVFTGCRGAAFKSVQPEAVTRKRGAHTPRLRGSVQNGVGHRDCRACKQRRAGLRHVTLGDKKLLPAHHVRTTRGLHQ